LTKKILLYGINFSLLHRLVLGAECWLMRRFDVVSTISQRMHQRLLDKGVLADKARLAVNWVDMAQFALPSLDGVAAYRRELGIADGAVVALYSGNMGGKQGLELLADVARLCSEVAFVFCGNGAGRADLVARCAGLPNVRFLDLQPLERLPDLLATADIHLLPQKAEAADLVMPMVQACGLVVPPENPAAFSDALKLLAADPVLCERLGAAGFLYAQENLDRDAVLAKFEADLQRVVLG